MIQDLSIYDHSVVLITGGLGFIGSNLVMRLADQSQAELRIVDSLHPSCGGNPRNLDGIARPVKIHHFDLREVSKLRDVASGVDVVFNLAGNVSHALSMKDPLTDLRNNVEAHVCLLETCRAVSPRARIVYSSTRQCYGRAQRLPVDERHPIAPVDINGINKYAAALYHTLYHRVYGLDTCCLRLTNTYGPRQLIRNPTQGVVGWFLHRVLCGEEIVIFGDGSQVRDLNYVDCVVDALLIAGKHPLAPGKIYNLGGTEPVSLLELARQIIEIYGQGSYRFVPFPEESKRIDIGDYFGSFVRIRQEMGWAPRVTLREGIRRTLDFYERNRAVYL